MKGKVVNNIIKMVIAIIMLIIYLGLIMADIVTYASSENGEENVIFEAWLEENGEKVNKIEKKIDSQDIELCMKVKVINEGYLNGKIELKDSNFKFKQKEEEGVSEITDNSIELKQINAGEEKEIKIGLEVSLPQTIDLEKFNKETILDLEGTYKNAKQKESKIEKENKVNIVLTQPYEDNEEKIDLQSKIMTNKIYNINGEKKRVVQAQISSKLEREGYPIEQTQIEVEAPEGVEKVEVGERGTAGTNGRSEGNNDEESLKINAEKEKVNIEINNKEKDGKIVYKQGKTDNFIITYIYPETAQVEGEIKTKETVKIYDESGSVFEREVSTEIGEEKEEIIGYQITNEKNIYKGKMYAKEEQEYKSMSSIDIRYVGIEQDIKIEEGGAKYQGENIEEEAKIEYRKSIISKEKLKRILGENGELIIQKEDGTEIRRINKDNLGEEENIIVEYPEGVEKIIIEIKNAEKAGTIQILNKKVIKQENLERARLKQINNITTKGKITKTENIEEKEAEGSINLKETETKAKIETTNNQLEAGTENKNVEIKTTLITNENKYDLYKNPTIEIEFPKEITEVSINNVSLLYGEELAKKSEEIYKNENGNQVIKVTLIGEQTKHEETGLTEGANIVVNCNVKVDKLEQNAKNNIVLKYTNEQEVEYTDKGMEETEINYIVRKEIKEEVNQVMEAPVEPVSTTDPIIVKKNISAGNNKDIYEAQVQKYTITVKNNTASDMQNIVVEDDIPEEMIYVNATYSDGFYNNYSEDESMKVYNKTIDVLKAGEETELYYYVRVKKEDENIGKTIENKAKVKTSDNNIYESNTIKNVIKEAKLQIDMIMTADEDCTYEVGSQMTYKIVIKNITKDTVKDINATNILPEQMSFVKAGNMKYSDDDKCYIIDEEKNAEYDTGNKKISWNIGELKANEEKAVYMIGKVEKGKSSIIENSLEISAKDMAIQYSNKEYVKVGTLGKCTITLESNLENKYLYEGDEFEYIITATNNSEEEKSLMVSIVDNIPEGLTINKITYQLNDEEEQELIANSVSVSEELNKDDKIKIYVWVKANELPNGYNELEIKNKAVVNSVNTGEIESNEITNIIKRNPNNTDNGGNNNGNNSGGNTSGEVYSISGIVWKDDNKNGSKDEEENGITGTTVKLYTKEGQEAKDKDGNEIMKTTGSDGSYILENIPKGNYVVIFEYNNEQYAITEYKRSGVSEEANSDVISTSKDGKKVGMTDNIQITNADIQNINMGLIESSKFDLRLDKYISEITVQEGNTTKKYGYENTQFAKIELNRKTVNNTNIRIKYQIKITNEGDIDGYANKIVDYMPSEMNFSTKDNKGWILENGQLINSTLEQEVIKSGESKTIELILTKKMTEDTLGTITNTAEIQEEANEFMKSDIDSTPGNKQANEDDISTVSVIIGLNTGRIILYISLTIAVIVILGVGIYLINKKVLGK